LCAAQYDHETIVNVDERRLIGFEELLELLT
jgi:hypothetical protein